MYVKNNMMISVHNIMLSTDYYTWIVNINALLDLYTYLILKNKGFFLTHFFILGTSVRHSCLLCNLDSRSMFIQVWTTRVQWWWYEIQFQNIMSISYIPTSKRGEHLVLKRLGLTSGMSSPSKSVLKAYDEIYSGDFGNIQALCKLFPPDGDVGPRRQRRRYSAARA